MEEKATYELLQNPYKNKISEADIINLRDLFIKNSGISDNLCLIIHPSREQEIIDIINSQTHVLPIWETDPIAKAIVKPLQIITFYGMRVYKDEFCPPNKIHILPDPEYQKLRKELL